MSGETTKNVRLLDPKRIKQVDRDVFIELCPEGLLDDYIQWVTQGDVDALVYIDGLDTNFNPSQVVTVEEFTICFNQGDRVVSRESIPCHVMRNGDVYITITFF